MDTLQATGVITSSYKGDSSLDDCYYESGDEDNNGSCDENSDNFDGDGFFAQDDDTISDGVDS